MAFERRLAEYYTGPVVRIGDSNTPHAAGADGAPLCKAGGDGPRRRWDAAIVQQSALCPACWQVWMREKRGVDIRNAWTEES